MAFLLLYSCEACYYKCHRDGLREVNWSVIFVFCLFLIKFNKKTAIPKPGPDITFKVSQFSQRCVFCLQSSVVNICCKYLHC